MTGETKQKFQDIEDLLTHRPPFIFVDELLEVDEEKTVARHVFRHDDEFFKGHFPGNPIVPGVLLVEMMAQCGGAGLRQSGVLPSGAFFVLGTVEKAKFRAPVFPGDSVIIEVKNLRVSSVMLRQSGIVKIHGKVAAEATWMCVIGKQEKESAS
ncbi:MAG: 3-hydroxyacyl-ACP dehydratase FabZ [Sphaerochaetaceae bacterium]|jgi:3-hydroxyacyl-[acyl-carrier-protein] dehydratase|nr:3-hydroxyacyl-ACP dehydratase FabZ [Sphaerochaetaceae bacterium]MDX9809633.1 3-hydroxyacyl-ACP dehydratase FabZ [Sphaerochaetaceae bacterium]NLV84423.1 3-hydroxyacyl-ACP dehydratase FabZ [Spirochaetales bacterium]